MQAARDLIQLMDEMRQERLRQPSDDLTSALVHAELDGDRLTVEELGSFFVLLTAAGNETTRNAIAHGVRLLDEYPDQRRLWQSDFEAYYKTAIEGIVRYASPVIYMRRTTLCDTELGGQRLREGEKVILYYTSANRDEAVFDNPDTFDISRKKNDHVGFGAGRTLLPRRQSGPPRNGSHVPRTVSAYARYSHDRRAGTPEVQFCPRHQTHAVCVYARAGGRLAARPGKTGRHSTCKPDLSQLVSA